MSAPKEWSKAYVILHRGNLVSHVLSKSKKFRASFERESDPPVMSLLIAWEYGRIWLKERDEFVAKRNSMQMPKRISNSFKWWLKKRSKKLGNKGCCVGK